MQIPKGEALITKMKAEEISASLIIETKLDCETDASSSSINISFL